MHSTMCWKSWRQRLALDVCTSRLVIAFVLSGFGGKSSLFLLSVMESTVFRPQQAVYCNRSSTHIVFCCLSINCMQFVLQCALGFSRCVFVNFALSWKRAVWSIQYVDIPHAVNGVIKLSSRMSCGVWKFRFMNRSNKQPGCIMADLLVIHHFKKQANMRTKCSFVNVRNIQQHYFNINIY